MLIRCLVLFCPLVVVLPVQAATWYVATNGSDSAPCTASQPCATVAQAATHMQAGDTVYLRGGTYGETLSAATRLPSGTSWSNAVTVAGHPGEVVTLTGGINLFMPEGGSDNLSYAIFDHFRVVGDATYGVLGANAHHIRFSNSERSGAPGGAGVGAGYGTHHVEFINLHVHHNGPSRETDTSNNPGKPGGHGFYICGKANVVRGCDIHDNGNYGLQVYDSQNVGCADDTIIEDNYIHDNHTGDGAATINYGSRARIARNRVVHNRGDGISIGYGNPDGVLFCGNTVSGNTGSGIYIGSGVTNTVLRGNTLSGNAQEVDDRGTGTRMEPAGGDCPSGAVADVPPPRPRPRHVRLLPIP